MLRNKKMNKYFFIYKASRSDTEHKEVVNDQDRKFYLNSLMAGPISVGVNQDDLKCTIMYNVNLGF